MNTMDIQMKTYLQEYIESKLNHVSEPSRVPQELISTYRTLAEFQSAVQQNYLEFQGLRQRHPQPTGFVRNALIHLQKLRKDKQKKYAYYIFKEFFTKIAFMNLPENLKSTTQDAIDFIDKRIDYFCSYTRKGLPDINSSYKEIINEAFAIKPETHPKEWKEINLVAKLLVKYLNNHGFNNYFFDMDKMINGEEIELTVLDYCDKATVLLLLAQQETFRDREDETNWCYREYDQYSITHNKKFFLVFRTENLVRPEDAGESILNWYDHVAGDSGIYGTTIETGDSFSKLKNSINNVAKEIKAIKEKVFDELVLSIK